MRIADANVMMGAARRYVQQGAKPQGALFEATGNLYASLPGSVRNTEAESKKTVRSGDVKTANTSNAEFIQETEDNPDLAQEVIGIKNSLLQEILQRMRTAGLFGGMTLPYGGFGQTAGFGGISAGMSSGVFSLRQTEYYESEETSFAAKGMARTEDGREIGFDVNIFMSRSFTSYTQIRIPTMSEVLFDPLMINVGSGVADISGQTFRFDLDMDGIEDDVRMPGKGTGFLALDLNEDGVINDGSELFGVASGDGFKDLAAYDSDGNGWIDENDEIFSRLKVWYKKEDGTDELLDLKEADVGAICLQSRQTDFSLYGADLKLNGMIRQTGLFLRESGGAGSVQHVDLAMKKGGAQNSEENGEVLYTGADQAEIPAGALFIHTEEQEKESQDAARTNTQSKNENRAERTERSSDRAKKAQEETDRRKAAQERRTQEAERRRASLERYQRRKELRKEQLERLMEERAEEEEILEAQSEQKAMHQDAVEEEYLAQSIAHGEMLDEMVDGQMMSVA